MSLRPARRALVLAVAGLLATAGAAFADTARADGDAVTPGAQTIVDLGPVAPSAVVSATIVFDLACSASNHVDVGQTVNLTWAAQSAPTGGAVLSATSGSIGPVPATWPADTVACPVPAPVLTGTTSTVTLRAPSVPNVGYIYTVGWSRSLSPAGTGDSTALSGSMTGISFRLDVVTNTPPVVTSAGDRTVTATVPGGWIADFPDVTATDAQDDPDPTPTCAPAAGTLLSVGPTVVTCSATDTGGLTGSTSFTVTVVNTPPVISVADEVTVEADEPGGWGVDWAGIISVTDAEDDPEPPLDCTFADGDSAPLGTHAVSCQAVDRVGQAGAAAFTLHVVDTTAPSLTGVPDDRTVTTDDPDGVAVSWADPTASDIADPAPVVHCSPASGATFAPGTTTVTCRATDASGNTTAGTFEVTVAYVPSRVATATWGEPIGSASPFVANRGRTIPVKVTLSVDGAPTTAGNASLALTPCAGGAATVVPLAVSGARWEVNLDTSSLGGACYEVRAVLGGLDAGGFTLELRGAEAAKSRAKGR